MTIQCSGRRQDKTRPTGLSKSYSTHYYKTVITQVDATKEIKPTHLFNLPSRACWLRVAVLAPDLGQQVVLACCAGPGSVACRSS